MTANGSSDPDRVRAEIEQTRADLGATVQALAAKTDVAGRTADRATEVGSRVEQDMTARTQAMRAKATGAVNETRAKTSASLGSMARSVQDRGRRLGLGRARRTKATIGEISGNARHQKGPAAGRTRAGAVGAVRSAIQRRPAVVAAGLAAAAALAVSVVGRQFRLGPGLTIRRRC
jgi:hypothetical protein